MPKPSNKTISLAEPAERPVTIAVSLAELCILRDHHIRSIKRVTSAAGKAMVQAATHSEHRAIIKLSKEQIDAHASRAKGLNAILGEHL